MAWRRTPVGLLSDAGHNVTDVAGLAMSLFAVRWALRPRSPSRSFGYHRGTILAALANVAVIATVTAAIVVESIIRLLHPHAVDGAVVMAVAAVALVLNATGRGPAAGARPRPQHARRRAPHGR